MPRRLLRVLVCDASVTNRARLQRAVEGDRTLHVVAAVANAEQAVEAAARSQADVILLGQGAGPAAAAAAVAATRAIMQVRATPVVVVADARARGEDSQSFALLEAGALAVAADPGVEGEPQYEAAAARLREHLRLMAEVKVVRRWAGAQPPAAVPSPAVPPPAARLRPPTTATMRSRQLRAVKLVAIGASTGGPVALRQVLAPLPSTFPVPILIVQHMADGFLPGMAAWLRGASAVPTELAAPGTELRPGHAYLAPDGAHMRVTAEGLLAFDAGPVVNGHRPAVSCLFASVAAHFGRDAVGVLLTGMGRDGAAELKLMKEAGALTIAQDEASSVVHGMPGEAIRLGAATYVLSPDEIGAALPALVLHGKASR